MKQVLALLLLSSFVGCAALEKKALLSPVKPPEKIFDLAWIKNLDPAYESGNLAIGFGSPLIVDDLVFMGSLDGHMRSFDLATGRLLWEQNEEQPIAAKPTFYNGQIIYGTREGRLFSRDYSTGKLRYAIDLGAPIESEPTVYDGRMFIHLRNHQLVAMDALTGKIFWNYKRSVPYTSTLQRVSRPLIYDNKIFIGFADGFVGALSVEEGLIIWERKITNKHKFIDVDADPLIYNGKLVIGSANGPLSFLNLETGLVVRTTDVVIGHSPQIVDDQLIVGTVNGEIVQIDREGGIVQRRKVSDNSISSIVPWKDNFAVATMGQKLYFVDKANFSVLRHFQLGSELSSVFGYLQEASGYLAVYSSRNRLYVFH